MGQLQSASNIMKNFCILLCVIGPAPSEPAKYAYQYGVKDDYTSNNFGQAESRDGYSAQGEYYVNLPDGRLQKVTYSVNGEGGYVADVTYTGEAQYPPEPAGGYGRK